MKEKYEELELEVIRFDLEDVITTSGDPEPEEPDENTDDTNDTEGNNNTDNTDGNKEPVEEYA